MLPVFLEYFAFTFSIQLGKQRTVISVESFMVHIIPIRSEFF